MFLSYQVRVLEWIYTLYLPEYQRTPCSKQARYVNILAISWYFYSDCNDCNGIRTHNHLFRKRALNHLAKVAKLVGLAESLSVCLRTK